MFDNACRSRESAARSGARRPHVQRPHVQPRVDVGLPAGRQDECGVVLEDDGGAVEAVGSGWILFVAWRNGAPPGMIGRIYFKPTPDAQSTVATPWRQARAAIPAATRQAMVADAVRRDRA